MKPRRAGAKGGATNSAKPRKKVSAPVKSEPQRAKVKNPHA